MKEYKIPEKLSRVAIIGYSGSGKSTLARKISKKMGLKVLHLDCVFWKSGWEPITPAQMQQEVAKFLDENDSWVIDGTYSKCHAERRMAEAELIIFMSFGRIECLKRAIKRYKRYKGRSRPSMTVGCNERINGSFLWWLLFKGRSRKNRAKYKAMISGNEDKTIIVKNQRQLNALYEALGL